MVYIDQIFDTSPYRNVPRCLRDGSCHMWADTIPELLEMAKRIGMKKEWLQNNSRGRFPHFDLSRKRRVAAIHAGAREMNLKEWLRNKRKKTVRQCENEIVLQLVQINLYHIIDKFEDKMIDNDGKDMWLITDAKFILQTRIDHLVSDVVTEQLKRCILQA